MSPEQPPHHIRLSPFMLWVPLALGFLLLAWAVQQAKTNKVGLSDNLSQIPNSYIDGPNSVVEVDIDRSGHYVFKGYINQQPVTFIVDTGATHVAVPEQIAKKLGLGYGLEYATKTANGVVKSRATLLESVKVGNIELEDVEGMILPTMQGEEILLGMSFISRLDVKQANGKLSFIQKYAK